MVSNRVRPSGQRVGGATVLLLDLLNTSFDNRGYARGQLLKYLESAAEGEQIAIYMLGKNLSVVQDFTDDRDILTQAVRKWDPKDLLLAIQSTENMDPVDREMSKLSAGTYARIRAQITAEAIAKITQHLSGMPGRKSLVWLSDSPGGSGSQYLPAANIHLYPVLARGVGSSGVFAWMRTSAKWEKVPPHRLPWR